MGNDKIIDGRQDVTWLGWENSITRFVIIRKYKLEQKNRTERTVEKLFIIDKKFERAILKLQPQNPEPPVALVI